MLRSNALSSAAHPSPANIWCRSQQALKAVCLLAMLSSFVACSSSSVGVGKGGAEPDLRTSGQQAQASQAAQAATLYFVRHAEKSDAPPSDPVLSPEGESRAKDLAAQFDEVPVDSLIACSHQRTRLTLAPLSKRYRLKVGVVLDELEKKVADSSHPLSPEDTRSEFLRLVEPAGNSTVVIASHSNVMPRLAASLSGESLKDLPEWQYDDIYVVRLEEDGTASLEKKKYGVLSLPD